MNSSNLDVNQIGIINQAVFEIMYSFVNPDKVLNPITKVFRGFGLWEPSSSFIYRIYGILYLSFFGLFILFMVAYAFLLEDTSQLSFALWMMLTEFCAFLKFIYVYAYNDDLLDIIQRIKAFQLRTDKERILMDKYMKFIYKCGIFFAWSALFSVHVNQLTAPTFDKPTLPFGTWLPFWEWKTCRKDYWRAWVYQYIAINTSVLILVCVEIVISFTLLMTSIQIEIVGKRLEDIGKPVKNLRDDGSQQIVGCDYLIECIHLHRTALDLKERIQKLMNVPYFCQVASSGIVISAIVVDLAKVCVAVKFLEQNNFYLFLGSR